MSEKQEYPFRAMALTSGILSQLAGCTLIGIFAGKWLDKQLHTMPIFLIAGLLLGLGTGVFGTLYLIRKFTGEKS
ncbi:AtpZ/AtpI family protein [Bacillaceae bacterium S4-13-56]